MVAIKICLLLSSVLFAYGANIGFSPKLQLDGRIVGGFPIEISQVPWQVSLQTRFLSSHSCGGSIIGSNWILTAAHCTASQTNLRSLVVRLGTSDRRVGGVRHKVKRIVQHKQYNQINVDYDYSLLELEKSIEFNDKAKPVALPDAEESVSDNTTCLVSGWGSTQSSSESTRMLRGVQIPIVNQQKCNNAYKPYGGITDRMICAGFENGGKGSCSGDSGGALVSFDDNNENPVVVGIVSWGYGCAKPHYPGVYSRVQVIRKWIFENTGL